eukprot:Opistho-2@61978
MLRYRKSRVCQGPILDVYVCTSTEGGCARRPRKQIKVCRRAFHLRTQTLIERAAFRRDRPCETARHEAAGEVRTLETFYNMLSNEPDRAYYGYDHVMRAAERLGVETLLISDELFRSQDVKTRKKYVALVEAVKNSNGDVKIFSSLHVSGEQLGQLSGVAAILRFPMPDIEDEEGDAHNA